MDTLVRLIFRIDFPTNYEMINRPGDVLRLLNDFEDAEWDGSQDSANRRQFVVYRSSTSEPKKYEDLIADTRSISGNNEWRPGISIKPTELQNCLDRASQVCSSMATEFNIDEIARIGVRMFVVGEPVPDFKRSRATFHQKFTNVFLGRLVEDLMPEDAAMIVEGTVHEEVKYRIQAGPGGAQDLVKFHEKLTFTKSEFETVGTRLFAADIDIFEHNLSFKGMSLLRWYRQKIPTFERLVQAAKGAVRKDAN